MRKFVRVSGIAVVIFLGLNLNSMSQVYIGNTEIDTSTIVTNLQVPWEILWGPDDHIWLTERTGTISRLNPETSELTELITIEDVYARGECGLLGMVLHPDFITHPYVYVVYNYFESPDIKERLVRYTYSDGLLGSPFIMLDEITAASNHSGSRLVIDADQKLYMTTGDASDTSLPQDLSSLNGKVLRMNLDGSVPEDNPFPGSYVWTLGHRNPQGLVISPLGIMYSSEHGPSSDDEVNILEKGRNYGWPNVLGFCSEPGELQFCADSNIMEPIAAWTPTLAVAGTDFYSHVSIPEWQNSLLVTSLKASSVTALQLSPDGRTVLREDLFFQNWFGRLRDLCISPDGRVFLAVSNRDGRGTVRTGDDRIVEIVGLNTGQYCTKEQTASICPGKTYNFNGLDISQPGYYLDTITNVEACDTIVSLYLEFYDEGALGLDDSLTMSLNDTVALSVDPGFYSYQWNNDPSLNTHSISLVGSQLGQGTYYYTLMVEDVNGCVLYDTTRVIINQAVGFYENTVLEFSVYPNPVSGNELNLNYSIESEARLMIYTQDGREIYRTTLYPANRHSKIRLPGTSGLYNLIIVSREGTKYVKVLKL